jgi:hypothetical protein
MVDEITFLRKGATHPENGFRCTEIGMFDMDANLVKITQLSKWTFGWDEDLSGPTAQQQIENQKYDPTRI